MNKITTQNLTSTRILTKSFEKPNGHRLLQLVATSGPIPSTTMVVSALACTTKTRRLVVVALPLIIACCKLAISVAFTARASLKLPIKSGFVVPPSKIISTHNVVVPRETLVRMDFFRRLFGGDNGDDSKDKDKKDKDGEQPEITTIETAQQKESTPPMPFFASMDQQPKQSEPVKESVVMEEIVAKLPVADVATEKPSSTPQEPAKESTVMEETVLTVPVIAIATEKPLLTPQEQALQKAQAMKRDAARFRMEAERMDIILSLEKITALEKKLEAAKKSQDEKIVQQVEDDIAILRRKLDPISIPKPAPKKKPDSDGASLMSSKGSMFSSTTTTTTASTENNKELGRLLDKPSNKFMRDLVAKTVGLEDSANTTNLLNKMNESDEVNATQLVEDMGEMIGLVVADLEDVAMSNAFPKSMRVVDDQGENLDTVLPSESDITLFMNQIVSSSAFIPSEKKPVKTSVGYVIRGTSRMADGNKLIDAMDDALQKKAPQLKDRLFFYYVEDPVPYQFDESSPMPTTPEELSRPLLLVTSSNILQGTEKRIGRVLTTAVAIGTSYFFSIFPFTFNEAINGKVDTLVHLGDGSQDLGFLTDLSEPLFFTFLGLTAAHELGHLAVASAYKFKTSFPTLIPSPATGLSSSITRFKTPPKNRQQLMDFALAGPWAGIVCSMIALLMGLQLTATMDAASFAELPALPTSFLQASTLIASIVDGALDNGLMQAPDPNAPIPLHPLAIAGYAGLMFNTLNLIPYGRTDGGRVSLAVFGRNPTKLINGFSLITLFVAGLGNDMFLLYFLFVFLFQGDPEIPMRNEVDDVGPVRVALALVSAAFVLMTLVPI